MSEEKDLYKLIKFNQQRLQKLKERQAIDGFNTPPEVLMEIETIQGELDKLKGDLAVKDTVETLRGYLHDKGNTLSKQTGPRATAIVQELLTLVLRQIEEISPFISQRYPDNPSDYETAFSDALTEALARNQDFADRVQDLLDRYSRLCAGASGEPAIVSSTSSIAHGTGASSATATGGSIAIGGNAHGDVKVEK